MNSDITLLEQGEIEMQGLLPWGSNYTFLVKVCGPETAVDAVYKPRAGERPLWDFARGTLCYRERAAYLVSEALGWGIVPTTVMREGPRGLGSLQRFVDHDANQHYFTFEGRFDEQVRRICLFDVLINNADRKSGHVLLTDATRLWAIDHGVSFHTDYKLRTVIWAFAGEPIPAPLLTDVERLADRLTAGDAPLRSALLTALSSREIDALTARARRLLVTRSFPEPGPGRHYPWPPV